MKTTKLTTVLVPTTGAVEIAPASARRSRLSICCPNQNAAGSFDTSIGVAADTAWSMNQSNGIVTFSRADHGDIVAAAWYGIAVSVNMFVSIADTTDTEL